MLSGKGKISGSIFVVSLLKEGPSQSRYDFDVDVVFAGWDHFVAASRGHSFVAALVPLFLGQQLLDVPVLLGRKIAEDDLGC